MEKLHITSRDVRKHLSSRAHQFLPAHASFFVSFRWEENAKMEYSTFSERERVDSFELLSHPKFTQDGVNRNVYEYSA